MSLKNTASTKHYNTIPRKCKNCSRAIHVTENSEIYYQCNLFGKFKRNCEIKASSRVLSKPEDIKEVN